MLTERVFMLMLLRYLSETSPTCWYGPSIDTI